MYLIYYLMKLFLYLFIFIGFFSVKAQENIVIRGYLKGNTKFSKVVIKKFGIGIFDIGAFPIENEKFTISVPLDFEPGIYRLQYSQTQGNYVDVIIDGKEKVITFSIDLSKEKVLPVFVTSLENKKWYNYQLDSELELQKINSLHQLLSTYPNPEDGIVKKVAKAAQKQVHVYKKAEQDFVDKNANNWSGWMVSNSRHYFTNPRDVLQLQDFEYKNQYWDSIDTGNPKLINTPLYTQHILNYLKYYLNPEMQFSIEEMESGLIKTVDIIMKKFSINESTQKFAFQYLQIGFKEIGQEKVLQYLEQHYSNIAKQCQSEKDNLAFEKRLKGYETIKPNMQAPNISYDNGTTTAKDLYSIEAKNTVIVFWASWCPHCMETMPKVNKWAQLHPEVKVVAMSLDEDKNAFETAIAPLNNLIHSCDFLKFEGKAAQEYYIIATPSFFVLDKDKKIVDKYSNFESVERLIEIQK